MNFKRKSVFTQAIEDGVAEFAKVVPEILEKMGPPIMHEKVKPSEMRQKLGKMTPEQRREWVNQVGIQQAMKVIGNGNL